jgi:hypothetical protein
MSPLALLAFAASLARAAASDAARAASSLPRWGLGLAADVRTAVRVARNGCPHVGGFAPCLPVCRELWPPHDRETAA